MMRITDGVSTIAAERRMQGMGMAVILMAIFAYAFVDRVVLSLLVEPIRADLGASDFQIGLLLGIAFAFLYAILSLPAGFIVDRVNRKGAIAVASVLWAAMTIVCGTANSMNQLFVGRAGVGIAEAILIPAAFSMIRDAVPERSRSLAFSIFAMAPLIGSAISLIGGGAILRMATEGAFATWPLIGGLEPWQATLMIIGILGLPLSVLLLFVREPVRTAEQVASTRAAAGQGIASAFVIALKHMRANIDAYAPLLIYAVFGAASSFASSAWLTTMLSRKFHLLPQTVGPMVGLIMLTCGLGGLILGGLFMNWLSRRRGDILIFGLVAAVGVMVGMGAAGLSPTLPLALASAGLGAAFLGISFPVGATVLGQLTPGPLMGRATAIFGLCQTMTGQAAGPLLVALASEHLFGGPTGLPQAFSLNFGFFGVGTIISVLALRAAMARRVVKAPVVDEPDVAEIA